MRNRPHASWLVAVGSVGIILGALGSLWFSISDYGSAVLACSTLSLVAGFGLRSPASFAMLFFAGICFGIWRGSSVLASHDTYGRWLGEIVELKGRVSEDPEYTDSGVRFRVTKPTVNGEFTRGTVWVSTSEAVELKRSHEISVRGKLNDGFGTVPAAMYDADVLDLNKVKYADRGRDIRDLFSAGISNAVQNPGSQLGSGILLGQKSALPERLEQELLVLGLTHIVVASGYNLTILVDVARKLFLRFSRFTALLASGLLISGFLTITGLSPSMVRASIVAGLSLAAWYFGRKIHPLVLLSFAGGITVSFNPTYVWGDLGWMLSFLSFAGVLVLAPLIQAYFWGQKRPGVLRGVLVETISAQIMTLPLLVYVFEQYSPLSVIANALIVPTIPFVMAFILAAGVSGVLVAPVAWVFGLPAHFMLWYYIGVTKILASLPFAQQEFRIHLWVVLASYCFGAFAVILLKKHTDYDFRNREDDWI